MVRPPRFKFSPGTAHDRNKKFPWLRGPVAHFNIATLLQATPGRIGEAIGHLRTVLKLTPDDAAARELLAKISPKP
jgi:hypothetical protein